MATSSKVKFKLEVLKQKALEASDKRIKLLEEHAATFEDDTSFARKVEAWRRNEVARICAFASRLQDPEVQVPDWEVAKFKIVAFPERNHYDHSRALNDVRNAKARQAAILAKSESLTCDEDGNIALTPNQLSEFFGL